MSDKLSNTNLIIISWHPCYVKYSVFMSCKLSIDRGALGCVHNGYDTIFTAHSQHVVGILFGTKLQTIYIGWIPITVKTRQFIA